MADTSPPSSDDGSSRGRCPICGRPTDPGTRPFCSKRCADIDLHRWLSGTYRVEAEDEPDDPMSDQDGPA